MPVGRRTFSCALRFGLLTLVAELTGRSLTAQLDRSLHVAPLAAPASSGYPLALAAIRTVAALAVASAAWRLLRAHATARAAERLLRTLGGRPARTPRLRLRLSGRLWLGSFGATTLWFLAESDLASISQGRWPLLAPWLHTFALPVFALLAVFVALAWGAFGAWVSEVERHAAASLASACRAVGAALAPPRLPRAASSDRTPRHLFGLAFESRPPPLSA